MNANIILIGCTGFIGKSIIHNLGKKVISYSSKNLNLLKKKNIKKKAKKFKNSIIIYAAGIKRTRGDTSKNFFKNLVLFNNLFSFFFKNKPKKVIFLSSAEVYGNYNKKKKIDEKTALDPVTQYSMAKIIQEKTIKFFSTKLGYEYIILRIPGVYGFDKENQNIISKLILSLSKKNTFIFNTTGNELRDYIFVNDIGKFISYIIKKNIKNLTINLATGKSYKIRNIVKMIEKNYKKKLSIKHNLKNYSNEYSLSFNNSLIKKKLPNFNLTNLNEFDFKKEFSK